MYKHRRITSVVMAFLMVFTIFGEFTTSMVFAATNYVAASRNVSQTVIQPDSEIEVTLSVKGTPPANIIKENDIMLLLDKSGSMQMDPDPNRFDAMIESAKEFIDLVDFKYHQVGIVDYSGNGQVSTHSLTTDGNALKSYIDGIVCGGGTYTHDAITKGTEVLGAEGRAEAQPVIILLTDGEPKNEEWAIEAAAKAKEAGIVFYTIALLGPNADPDTSKENLFLRELATTAHHHNFVLGSVGLIDIYRAIVKEIGVASAYDVVITETVADEFEIVEGSYSNNIPVPTVNGNTLTWNLLELKASTLDFTYKIRVKDGVDAGKYDTSNGSIINYKNYTGKDCSLNVKGTEVTLMDFAPEITSISPSQGDIAGGQTVTITGEHFKEGATVQFKLASGSTVNAQTVEVINENTISVVTPVGVQGEASVIVTNLDRQKATTTYTYTAEPVISRITPVSGPFEGGNTVKIYGSYFLEGAQVFFGDQEAQTVKFTNSTYMLATAPKATEAGTVDVKVVNPDGLEGTLADAYTYEPEIIEEMELTAIDVIEGPIEGGTTVTLQGKLFETGAEVFFGNEAATVVTCYPTKITVKTPAHAEGTVDVSVVNPDGSESTLTDAFTFFGPKAPEVTSISPNVGEYAGGELIIINGANFDTDVQVTIDGQEAAVVNYYSTSKIRVRVPAANQEGTVDVKVVNPTSGLSVTVADGYEYLPQPELPDVIVTALSATEGAFAGGNRVYITGENFEKSGLVVKFGNQEATVYSFLSNTRIQVIVPQAEQAGTVDVTVINADGRQGTLENAYTYAQDPALLPPEVLSLSATQGEYVGGELVYINGTNIQQGATVTFGSQEATVTNWYSTEKIRVRVPAAVAEGLVDVTVTNPNGESGTLAAAYEYLPEPEAPSPVVTSLSQTEGYTIGGDLIYVTGENFEDGLQIFFGDAEGTLVNYYSAERIRVKVPVNSAGTVDVRVVNPTGKEGTLVDGYTYNEYVPTITSVSPKEGAYEGGEYVIIEGENFERGLTVTIDGQEATIANFYSANKIRILTPEAKREGLVDIVITNVDGSKAVAADAYKYYPAAAVDQTTIRKITATTSEKADEITSANKSTIVFVHGIKFSDVKQVKIVDADGIETLVKPLNVYSDIKMRFKIPATVASGAAQISLVNSDGTESDPVTFTFN